MEYPKTIDINGQTWTVEKWTDLLQYHFHDISYAQALAQRKIDRLYPKVKVIAVDDYKKDGEEFRWKLLLEQAAEL